MGEASVDERPSFTCPKCRRTSWHPEDVKHGYCGACHEFVSVDEFVHVPSLTELSAQGLAWPGPDGRWGVSAPGHALLGDALRENGRRAAQLEGERTPPVSRDDLPSPGEVDR